MQDFNLLPQEKRPSKGVLAMSSTLKKLGAFMVMIMIVGMVVFVSIYLLQIRKNKDLATRQGVLEEEIKNLERSEQRLVLIKDRINKIKNIDEKDLVGKRVEKIKNVIDLTQSPTKIIEVFANDKYLEIRFYTDNSQNMVNMISTLVNSGKFVSVHFLSFNYRVENGYQFSLALI